MLTIGLSKKQRKAKKKGRDKFYVGTPAIRMKPKGKKTSPFVVNDELIALMDVLQPSGQDSNGNPRYKRDHIGLASFHEEGKKRRIFIFVHENLEGQGAKFNRLYATGKFFSAEMRSAIDEDYSTTNADEMYFKVEKIAKGSVIGGNQIPFDFFELLPLGVDNKESSVQEEQEPMTELSQGQQEQLEKRQLEQDTEVDNKQQEEEEEEVPELEDLDNDLDTTPSFLQ